MAYPYDAAAAVAHLRTTDRDLAALIRRVGPYRLELRAALTPLQALLRAIVYQQLSGRAAAAIYRRVLAQCPRGRPPSARRLAELPDETLRAAGLSRAKVAAVRDLAAKALDGTVPGRRALARMDDDEIVARLTAVRGVGRWTVEMLLIFHLGRADVLPLDDLGVRKGFRHAYGGDALPRRDELEAAGERWRPYRSVASWYLWRAADAAP